jgi:hypothetical protein
LNISRKKILVQVNSSFDLYIFTALLRDKRSKLTADLLAPYELLDKLPSSIRSSYGEIFGFNPRIRNLFSPVAVSESFRLISWARNRLHHYYAVLFGAYRNDITSLLARIFFEYSLLFCIKQGIEVPDTRYIRFKSLRSFHNDLYYRFFGYSSFHMERLIQNSSPPEKSDYMFIRSVWKHDPFKRDKNVFTIGDPRTRHDHQGLFLLPDFRLMRNNRHETLGHGILIIGERTPMVPSWGQEQNLLMHEIFSLIVKSTFGEQIYVRGRKKLTNNTFYSQLNPVFLDPDQIYEDQLLKLNPRLVISVKSTASKVAAYYGYPSVLLYDCLNFDAAEKEHLDYLFDDGAPIDRCKLPWDIPTLLSKERILKKANDRFSAPNCDVFFDRLSR